MKKRKKTKKEKKRLFIISIILIGLLSMLSFSVYDSMVTIMENKKTASMYEKQFKLLLDEGEELEKQKTKYQYPEYIVMYIKKNRMMTEEGDVLLRMND